MLRKYSCASHFFWHIQTSKYFRARWPKWYDLLNIRGFPCSKDDCDRLISNHVAMCTEEVNLLNGINVYVLQVTRTWLRLVVCLLLYWEPWRLCRSFINLTEWRQRRVTCKQLIGYINTREKIRYFFTCFVTAFLRVGNPYITPQFMW